MNHSRLLALLILLTTFTAFSYTQYTIDDNSDWALNVFDIDFDNNMDIISSNSWYKSDGNGGYTNHIFASEDFHPWYVTAIDIDGDLDGDILTADRMSNEIALFTNDGSENFTKVIVSESAEFANSVFAIDLDGDTDIDILSASMNDGTVAWYENDGNENFTTHIIYNGSNGVASVYAIDIDSDNDIDVLSSSQYDNRVIWYENDGDENFTTHEISTNGGGALWVDAFDIDNDLDIDIVSCSMDESKIYWHENDGSENFTRKLVTEDAYGVESLRAVDIDLDGDGDIIAACSWSQKVVLYENDDSQNFTATTLVSGEVGFSVCSGDLTGNGTPNVVAKVDGKIHWFEEDLEPMVLEFNTNLSTGTTIEIPLGGTVDVTIDWGDGDVENFTTTGYKEHTYAIDGEYSVQITGALTRLGISSSGNSEYKKSLTSVDSWGDLGLTSLIYAFYDCVNLASVPTTLPSTITNTREMFYKASSFNSDISGWDVSKIIDMSYMFTEASSFNCNLEEWDVSSVANMNYMFTSATSFDQDIGNWKISNAITMISMFAGVTLSTVNYESLLKKWSALTEIQGGVIFHGGKSTYRAEAGAYKETILLSELGWVITDGGLVANSAPTFTSATAQTTGEETSIDLTLDMIEGETDADGDALSLVVVDVDNDNYSLVGTTVTPDKDFTGELTVPVMVNDGFENSVSVDMIITVTNVDDDAPTVKTPLTAITVDEDAVDSLITLSSLLTDIDNDDANITKVVSSNSNETLLLASIVGNSLTLDFLEDQNGTATIEITGTSNGKTIISSFEVTVTAVNDHPVITSTPTTTATEDTEWSYTITATDVDGDIPTFTATNLPTGMVLSGNILTWTPQNGIATSGEITVTANDGNNALADQKFTVVVTGVNDAPTLTTTTSQTMKQGGTITLTLEMTDALDIDEDVLELLVDNSFTFDPTIHSYSVSENVITPRADFFGEFEASVRVTDGVDTSAYIKLKVIVDQVVAINQIESNRIDSESKLLFAPNPVPSTATEVLFITPSTLTAIRGEWEVTIYDNLGNVIDFQSFNSDGGYTYSWDLTNYNGQKVSAGMYVAIISVENDSGVKEMFKRVIGVKQ
jgi:surface protein